jgi:hypothetical protein
MTRWVQVAAAQLGPNQELTPREELVARMLALLEQALADGDRWNFLGRGHPWAYASLARPVRVPETKSRLGEEVRGA